MTAPPVVLYRLTEEVRFVLTTMKYIIVFGSLKKAVNNVKQENNNC